MVAKCLILRTLKFSTRRADYRRIQPFLSRPVSLFLSHSLSDLHRARESLTQPLPLPLSLRQILSPASVTGNFARRIKRRKDEWNIKRAWGRKRGKKINRMEDERDGVCFRFVSNDPFLLIIKFFERTDRTVSIVNSCPEFENDCSRWWERIKYYGFQNSRSRGGCNATVPPVPSAFRYTCIRVRVSRNCRGPPARERGGAGLDTMWINVSKEWNLNRTHNSASFYAWKSRVRRPFVANCLPILFTAILKLLLYNLQSSIKNLDDIFVDVYIYIYILPSIISVSSSLTYSYPVFHAFLPRIIKRGYNYRIITLSRRLPATYFVLYHYLYITVATLSRERKRLLNINWKSPAKSIMPGLKTIRRAVVKSAASWNLNSKTRGCTKVYRAHEECAQFLLIQRSSLKQEREERSILWRFNEKLPSGALICEQSTRYTRTHTVLDALLRPFFFFFKVCNFHRPRSSAPS